MIEDRKYRDMLLLYFTPLLFVFLKIGRSDHMLIPLYPYFAIGMAALLLRLYHGIRSSRKLRILLVPSILLMALPFAVTVCKDFSAFVLAQGIDKEDPVWIKAAADYVNKNTNEADFVIASVHTARFITSQKTEYAIAYISDNRKFKYMDYTLGPERFTFNSSPRNAKFFITDRRLDVSNNTEDYTILVDLLGDPMNWSSVQIGNMYVYKNPQIPL